MNKFAEENIKNVITSIHDAFEQELFSKTEAELEDYWFFKYDKKASIANNIYNFYDMLGLYHRYCRRWEEKKNGSCCVVERVRDKYLMPKIREFTEQIIRALEFQNGVVLSDIGA